MATPIADASLALLHFLVRRGLIPGGAAQVVEAELHTRENGPRLIEWLARKGLVSEEAVAHALAEHLHLPYVDLASVPINRAVIELVKEDVATRYAILPLRAPDGHLTVATANPLDREAQRAVEFATGRRVHAEVATYTALQDALGHAYHLDQALDAYLKGVRDDGDAPVADLTDDSADIRSLMRGSTLPPVVKLFNMILVEGIRSGASDVHIEPSSAALGVRYRVDGILAEAFRLPKWIQDPVTARCKVLARMDITERRVPQDGRIRLQYRGATIDLRISSLPTQYGEKLTMRILDPNGTPTGLEPLGLVGRDLASTRRAIKRPEGMILVTGPTGSGKSTTLYGMMAEIISPTRNIVTIENPIEYQMRGVTQVEINEKQGLTFAGTLRSTLRQDPDVILVGEIRDNETAEIALRAAQTGHLVLSTLHTNDCASTITRLIDIGIEPYMLASSLHLVASQRLARRTCEQCAQPYEPQASELQALQITGTGHRFRRGRGCAACHNSGYVKRVGIFEVMPITAEVAQLIEARASEAAVRTLAREEGMRTLSERAADLVCAGVTTAEEVLRVVDVADEGVLTAGGGPAGAVPGALCPHCGAPMKRAAPVAPLPAVPAPPVSPPPVAAPAGRQFRALVVDDEEDCRALIAFTLENSNLPILVESVASGPEALARVQHAPPDLILLDVMMPEMDGVEVCEQLRANVRTAFLPILMLTGLDDPGSRARGFLAGTDDYIGKPFARADLLARVRRLLQRTYGNGALPPGDTPPAPNPSEATEPERMRRSA